MLVLCSFASAILTDNLVSYWGLADNAANTAVVDSVGTNNGTASTNTNNLNAAGKLGDGFNFTVGSSEYVDTNAPGVGTAFTVTVWFRYYGTAIYSAIIGDENGVTDGWKVLFYNQDPNPQLTLSVSNSGRTTQNLGTAGQYDDGNWHFLTVTNDGSDNWEIQVDDVAKYTGSTAMAAPSQDHAIGDGGVDPATNYFDGDIDDVGYWSVVKSDADLTSLFNGGAGLAYPFASNAAPTFDETPTNESIIYTSAFEWDVNGSDTDGDLLNYTTNGTIGPPYVTINNDTGMINATFTSGNVGSWTFEINISDGTDTTTAFLDLEVNNTCTPPGTGNWAVAAADACTWSSAQQIPGNLTITGSGALTLTSILNFTSTNQYIFIKSGGSLVIGSGGEIRG